MNHIDNAYKEPSKMTGCDEKNIQYKIELFSKVKNSSMLNNDLKTTIKNMLNLITEINN